MAAISRVASPGIRSGGPSPRVAAGAGAVTSNSSPAQGPEASTLGTRNVRGAAAAIRAIASASARTRFAVRSFQPTFA